MESKIKLVRRTGFTVLPNQLLRDPTLTLQAKGLFAMMASYPDDWEYSVRGLAADIGCGRDKVRSALQNLEDSGYLLREQVHTESGKFAGNLYVLYDEKISPLPGFPAPENPLPENPTQTKERLTKERLNNPLYPPKGGRGGARHTRTRRTGSRIASPDSGASTRPRGARTSRRPSGPGTSSGRMMLSSPPSAGRCGC